jgi:hypothetical protein
VSSNKDHGIGEYPHRIFDTESAARLIPVVGSVAGFSSFLADKLGLGERQLRFPMLSGAGGGVIFRAPLRGTLFVV